MISQPRSALQVNFESTAYLFLRDGDMVVHLNVYFELCKDMLRTAGYNFLGLDKNEPIYGNERNSIMAKIDWVFFERRMFWDTKLGPKGGPGVAQLYC